MRLQGRCSARRWVGRQATGTDECGAASVDVCRREADTGHAAATVAEDRSIGAEDRRRREVVAQAEACRCGWVWLEDTWLLLGPVPRPVLSEVAAEVVADWEAEVEAEAEAGKAARAARAEVECRREMELQAGHRREAAAADAADAARREVRA